MSVARRLGLRLKRAADATLGAIAVLLLNGIGRIDPVRLANFAAALLRTVGPWFPEHRVGRENLRAAFP